MMRMLALASLLALLWPTPASADRYRPLRAAHPLRIAAYALHPFGVLLDRAIFRPLWELGQHEPVRSLFGVEGTPSTASGGDLPSAPNPFLEPYRESP